MTYENFKSVVLRIMILLFILTDNTYLIKYCFNCFFIVDLSCTNKFEVELGSSLRHRSNASRKLKQLTVNAAKLKINNQVRYC